MTIRFYKKKSNKTHKYLEDYLVENGYEVDIKEVRINRDIWCKCSVSGVECDFSFHASSAKGGLNALCNVFSSKTLDVTVRDNYDD